MSDATDYSYATRVSCGRVSFFGFFARAPPPHLPFTITVCYVLFSRVFSYPSPAAAAPLYDKNAFTNTNYYYSRSSRRPFPKCRAECCVWSVKTLPVRVPGFHGRERRLFLARRIRSLGVGRNFIRSPPPPPPHTLFVPSCPVFFVVQNDKRFRSAPAAARRFSSRTPRRQRRHVPVCETINTAQCVCVCNADRRTQARVLFNQRREFEFARHLIGRLFFFKELVFRNV